MDSSQDRRSIRQVASLLSFQVDEDTLDDCLATFEDLQQGIEVVYDSKEDPEHHGHRSNDDYNALLDVYDEPRKQENNGPLDGLSLAVKDSIMVRNLEMTAGCDAFSFVPSEDAVITERLLNHGAAIVGKSNLESFAFGITGENSDFGTVTNPVAEGHVSGGSSSGSGAAVAGGLVDAAIGTDAGGSIRIPAACCGIVGAKPTHGLVPRHGLVDFAPSMDTIGPLANDVETAGKILEAIAGYDLRDPSSSRVEMPPLVDALESDEELIIGLPTGFFAAADDAVTNVVRGVMEQLEENDSANTQDIDIDMGEISTAYFVVSSSEFARVNRQTDAIRGQGTGYTEELRAAFAEAKRRGIQSEHLVERVLPGAYLDECTAGKAYAAARRETIAFQQRLDSVFEEVDLLVTPTLQRLPPEYDEVNSTEETLRMLGNTSIFNLTGNPGVAVPAGEINGLPVSAQVVAPQFEDGRALSGARRIEQALEEGVIE